MRKYWVIFLTFLSENLQFRGELFLWIFYDALNTFTFLVIWAGIYSGGQSFGGFSLAQMMQYYVAVFLVENITQTRFENGWISVIRNGYLDMLLTKPFPIFGYMITQELSKKMLSFILALPFILGFSLCIPFFSFPKTFALVMYTVAFFMGSFFFNSFLSIIIATCAFWFDEAKGIGHFISILQSLFGGFLLPLVLLPSFLQRIALRLPFQHTVQTPAFLLSGRIQSTDALLSAFIVLISSTVFLYFFASFLWKKGIRTYTSAGG
ncbi:MAG: hypothetical protein UX04_C0002G0151 [Microgenomates group bacterium GW2011_GWF2_45_18]|nr:MAG: hypothetical protein UW18_C0005G0022 [Microgenomates group bacterium GW2011_GWF1_44_10]KKU02008.1 MAG: hypothetical protein UX04_C0002G0151 [Microgenomates group bacterium GW2011_GWF2_45_18]OGJ41194.1 MAG: hypothetical protein A2378_00925 [Candidatus Pacebacteria bacterium RIFOXYB1_FULL_44_10]HAU99006.1 hypothetical protein [Candidatus Paceibacterota bacterium]HAX01280.1 hypothetical protein [Candidatus Paceibacterota bacterium]